VSVCHVFFNHDDNVERTVALVSFVDTEDEKLEKELLVKGV
jgi:hypothetical protein